MTTMVSFPVWVGLLGWGLLLLGFLLQRRALRIEVSVGHRATGIGVGNSIVQHGDISVPTPPPSAESALSRWGSWASIIGLAITAWPFVKPLLAV